MGMPALMLVHTPFQDPLCHRLFWRVLAKSWQYLSLFIRPMGKHSNHDCRQHIWFNVAFG
jgi:hypothetical protein